MMGPDDAMKLIIEASATAFVGGCAAERLGDWAEIPAGLLIMAIIIAVNLHMGAAPL